MVSTNSSILISLDDPSSVGAARRYAIRLCEDLGFNATLAGKASVIVTEAANNVIKHARQGRLILRTLECKTARGLEVLTSDAGPGMDVARCLQDGYSTAGSPGTGMGAMARMSSSWDIFSEMQKGTVSMARLWDRVPKKADVAFEVGAICLPMTSGDACGDAWRVLFLSGRTKVFVVDGLGHGELAARAAQAAIRAFHELEELGPQKSVEAMHLPLRSTRGASLAVAEIDHAQSVVRYAGVGNIATTIIQGAQTRSLVSYNGTVGHEMHGVKEFTYPWSPNAVLVMHSDGLQTRWRLDAYPGLLSRHASTIAGVLYRDFLRGRDDVTVLVVKTLATP